MKLQTIKSAEGIDEYVLLPVHVYNSLRNEIDCVLKKVGKKTKDDYIAFDPANYIKNPIALARIKIGMTQAELAVRAGVTQAYVSKIERQELPSPKVVLRFRRALKSDGKHAA